MLAVYRQQVQRLVQDTPLARFVPADFDFYINTARGQLAGESECIRNYATLAVSNILGQQYPFSAVTLAAGTVGVAGPLQIRKATFALNAGQVRMYSREWEWFENFVLAQSQPIAGQPYYWAQFGQGASGTIFVNLLDQAYTLSLDTVCYPLPLASDADPEAIPYEWTDAVPYYAAYMAYLSAQDSDRAAAMFKVYGGFAQRARAAATPGVLPHQFAGGPDLMMANRLGVTPPRGGGQPA